MSKKNLMHTIMSMQEINGTNGWYSACCSVERDSHYYRGGSSNIVTRK